MHDDYDDDDDDDDVDDDECAEEFKTYLENARGLAFAEKPNYDYLRGLFKGLMEKNKWSIDWEFDWIVKEKVGDGVQTVDIILTYYN